jgi:hypothetical protein
LFPYVNNIITFIPLKLYTSFTGLTIFGDHHITFRQIQISTYLVHFISFAVFTYVHNLFLKNSKDLLDSLKSRSFSQVSSIKTLDFSTLNTTLPHEKLKTRLKETIHKAFSHRNYGSKFVVLGYNSTYSTKFKKVKHATPRNKWSVCWSSSSITYFSPFVGIPMGTNCAPLLADLF